MLDLSSMEKSIRALENSLESVKRLQGKQVYDNTDFETMRAGVIQNFETAYEQSWKMMKRWIDDNFEMENETTKSKKQLFRLAGEFNLIDDFQLWVSFHEKRNLTVHTYDGDTAEEVFEAAVRFLPEGKKLLAILESRND